MERYIEQRKERIPLVKGAKYNRLTVIERAEDTYTGKKQVRKLMYKFLCDCGKEHVARKEAVISGEVRSCGCLLTDTAIANFRTHGQSRTSLYTSWQAMKKRCSCETDSKYEYYGGRGITVCEEWLDFEVFLADMGTREPGYSLDRIDNSKGYSKENCRWATKTEQILNRRISKTNKSGVRGVGLYRDGKWFARIGHQYTRIHLGYFENFEDAVDARKAAEEKYHGAVPVETQETTKGEYHQ